MSYSFKGPRKRIIVSTATAAQARGPDDHGIHVQFDQHRQILGRIARHAQDGADQRVNIGGRLAAIAAEQFSDAEALQGGFYGAPGPRRQQTDAVGQDLSEHAARAENQYLAKLRVDDDTDQNFGDAVGEHFFHQQNLR